WPPHLRILSFRAPREPALSLLQGMWLLFFKDSKALGGFAPWKFSQILGICWAKPFTCNMIQAVRPWRIRQHICNEWLSSKDRRTEFGFNHLLPHPVFRFH